MKEMRQIFKKFKKEQSTNFLLKLFRKKLYTIFSFTSEDISPIYSTPPRKLESGTLPGKMQDLVLLKIS